MRDRERCIRCDDETGKAGRADDSLYLAEYGPYCEECYPNYAADDLSDRIAGLEQSQRTLRSRLAAAEEREAALRVDRERLIALLEHHEPSGDCGNAGCGTCLLGYVLRHLKEDGPFPELNTPRIRAALDKETTCDS